MPHRSRFERLPDACTVTDVQRYLGVSRSTVYRAVWRGALPSIYVGGLILVPKWALVIGIVAPGSFPPDFLWKRIAARWAADPASARMGV